MARHEAGFRSSAAGPLSLDDLVALLGDADARAQPDRYEAIACYLSAGEGWTEAVQRLGGAFAEQATRLTESKAD